MNEHKMKLNYIVLLKNILKHTVDQKNWIVARFLKVIQNIMNKRDKIKKLENGLNKLKTHSCFYTKW